MNLEVAMEYHLTCNHYPPVHRGMIAPCVRLVKALESMYPEHRADYLSKSMTINHHVVSRREVYDDLHLDVFVQGEDDDTL